MTQKLTQNEQLEILKDLGLDERESEIYLTLLTNGPLLPQYLSRKTGIKRSTLYIIFPGMIQKGVIQEISRGKRRLLQAITPDKLYEDYQKKANEVKEGIGELMALYKAQGLRPHVEFYEGVEGARKIFMDIIEEDDRDLRVFNRIAKYNPEVLDWVLRIFVPLRIRSKMFVRALVASERVGKEAMPTGREYLRESRFVPLDKFPFRAGEAFIYGNKVGFILLEEGGPLMGVIINSKQIVQNLSALFDLAWEGAEKYQK